MARPLGPPSLWIDDAWIALVVRADGVSDVLLVGLTAPGFALLLAGLLQLTGFSETAAQAVPYLFGVASPAALYVVARRSGVGRAGALLAAGVLLSAPELLTSASRVKQFSAEALVVVLLIGVAAAVLRSPGAGRAWGVLVGLSLVGITLSSATAVTAAAAVAAGALAAVTRRSPLRPALLGGGVLAAFSAGWSLLVIAPSTTPTLRDYWMEHFTWRAVTGVLDHLAGVPVPVTGAVLAASTAVVLRRDPALAVLLTGPLVLSAALASAGIAPLGGGRTDVHLYPTLALLVGTALDTLLHERRSSRRAVTGAAAAVTALVMASPGPYPYPSQDVSPYVAVVDEQGRPGDVVLVYADTRWAFALYTDRPVQLRPSRRSMTGFEVDIAAAVPGGADLVVLPDANVVPELLVPTVRDAAQTAERVWFVMSHLVDERDLVEGLLVELGLQRDLHQSRPGAALTRWVRPG